MSEGRTSRPPQSAHRRSGNRAATMPERKSPKRDLDPTRRIGAAITSCAGVGGAITISAHHGSTSIALLVFGTMQLWGACELFCKILLKWRYAKLHEFLARKAAENPDDQHLRTLLIDVASTSLSDIGDRIPTRHELK